MANPNISLLGATYSGVAGVTLPKSGGGTATFPWVEGSQTVTQNGTVDVTNLAQLIVNVAGGSGGLEYETGIWEPEEDIARGTIAWNNAHTEAPFFVVLADVTGTGDTTTNTNYFFAFSDPYKLWNVGFPFSSKEFRYACVQFYSRGSSANPTASSVVCSQKSSSTVANSNSYPRYWVSPTEFHPYSNNTSRYWRAGRTYKWIAVWKPST
jgi:hypothetical protein